MNMNKQACLLTAVFLSLTCQSTAVFGQDPAALETMFVEATRQTENIQNIPIAVDVIDVQQLEGGTIINTVDIGTAVPGITVTRYTSVEPQYFIRGVGSTGGSAGEDHSVVVFSDDSYVGRTGSTALDFLDLERVEVLKGPQGTLFGRNAAGGVIQLIPKKPSAEREVYVSAGAGNLNQRQFQFAAGGNIAGEDQTNARIAAAYSSRDGDVSNLLTASDNLREKEASGVRAQLAHHFNDALSLRVSSEYAKRDDIGVAPRKSSSSNIPLIAGGFIPVPQPTSDLQQVSLAIDGISNQDLRTFAAHVDADLGFGQFKSVSSWRNSEFQVQEDVSGVGLIVLAAQENTDLLTQEFRIYSNTDAKITWTAGLYLLREKIDRADTTDLSAISDLVNLNPVLLGLPAQAVIPDQRATYQQRAVNESVALYGEMEIPISDEVSALLGLRQTFDSKELDLNATGNDPLDFGLLAAGPFSDDVNERFRDLSGKLGIIYRNNSALMSYIHLSKAYKAGGFDGNASSIEALRAGFDSENAYTLEWGIKLTGFDNRLALNAALFFNDYQDLQVFQVTNNGTTLTSNAAEAEIRGFEFDIRANIHRSLSADFACTFLNTEYTTFISDVDDDLDGLPDDLAGNELTRAPDYSCASSLLWSPDLQGKQPLSIDLSYAYQDDIFITPQNREFDTIEAYGLTNLSMRYAFSDTLSATLSINNLTDEDYKLHTFDADPLIRNNIESSVYGLGRLWSASLKLSL
jgi:iron complex outermembrane receptor protein